MQINNPKTLSILDQIFFGARNFIISALIVRWLGAESFGYYILLMTMTTLIVRVHSALVNLPLSMHEKSHHGLIGKYLARHFIVCALMILIAIVVFLFNFPYKLTHMEMAVFVLGSVSFINNELHRRFCLINAHYLHTFLLNICMCASSILVLYFFHEMGASSPIVAYFSFVVGGVPSWIFIIKKLNTENIYNSGLELRKVDLDVGLGFTLQWLSAQCVYYLAFLYIGVGAVAVLGVYRTLFAPFIILVSALDGYLPAKLASYSKTKNKFQYALAHEFISIAGIILIAACAIFFLYDEIISELFGPVFVDKHTAAYLCIYFVGMTVASCSRVLIISMRSLNVNANLTYALLASIFIILCLMPIMSDLIPDLAAPVAITAAEIVLLIAVVWRFYIAIQIRSWS